jgi:hypothetical protein
MLESKNKNGLILFSVSVQVSRFFNSLNQKGLKHS